MNMVRIDSGLKEAFFVIPPSLELKASWLFSVRTWVCTSSDFPDRSRSGPGLKSSPSLARPETGVIQGVVRGSSETHLSALKVRFLNRSSWALLVQSLQRVP